MKAKLEKLKHEILEQLAVAKDSEVLKNLELRYFSRKGELSQTLKSLKDLGEDARRDFGQFANEIKEELNNKFNEVRNLLSSQGLKNNFSDITLPGEKTALGHLHPITLIQNELEDLFSSLGFLILDGPELESDYYNFESLNFPKNHPAREMQDTFFIDRQSNSGEYDLLLRTHTSSAQVRAMEKYGAPLKGVIPGRVFRSESTDVRHEHTFYQFEGLMIDENINFTHLKGVLEFIGRKLYGPNTRLRMRPKYYPFVEPGSNGEYSCFLCSGRGCRVCKNSGWLEIMGCGMIHPNVLKAGGIDSEKYSGFAFGFGLNRLAMLKYDINDTRLFNSGDLRFSEQF